MIWDSYVANFNFKILPMMRVDLSDAFLLLKSSNHATKIYDNVNYKFDGIGHGML